MSREFDRTGKSVLTPRDLEHFQVRVLPDFCAVKDARLKKVHQTHFSSRTLPSLVQVSAPFAGIFELAHLCC